MNIFNWLFVALVILVSIGCLIAIFAFIAEIKKLRKK